MIEMGDGMAVGLGTAAAKFDLKVFQGHNAIPPKCVAVDPEVCEWVGGAGRWQAQVFVLSAFLAKPLDYTSI